MQRLDTKVVSIYMDEDYNVVPCFGCIDEGRNAEGEPSASLRRPRADCRNVSDMRFYPLVRERPGPQTHWTIAVESPLSLFEKKC